MGRALKYNGGCGVTIQEIGKLTLRSHTGEATLGCVSGNSCNEVLRGEYFFSAARAGVLVQQERCRRMRDEDVYEYQY